MSGNKSVPFRLKKKSWDRIEVLKEKFGENSHSKVVDHSLKVTAAVSEYADDRNMLQVVKPDGEQITIFLE